MRPIDKPMRWLVTELNMPNASKHNMLPYLSLPSSLPPSLPYTQTPLLILSATDRTTHPGFRRNIRYTYLVNVFHEVFRAFGILMTLHWYHSHSSVPRGGQADSTFDCLLDGEVKKNIGDEIHPCTYEPNRSSQTEPLGKLDITPLWSNIPRA